MRSSAKMTRKNGQLYILEKVWKISYPYDFIFKKDSFDYALIRICNVDYKTYNDFILGKKIASVKDFFMNVLTEKILKYLGYKQRRASSVGRCEQHKDRL